MDFKQTPEYIKFIREHKKVFSPGKVLGFLEENSLDISVPESRDAHFAYWVDKGMSFDNLRGIKKSFPGFLQMYEAPQEETHGLKESVQGLVKPARVKSNPVDDEKKLDKLFQVMIEFDDHDIFAEIEDYQVKFQKRATREALRGYLDILTPNALRECILHSGLGEDVDMDRYQEYNKWVTEGMIQEGAARFYCVNCYWVRAYFLAERTLHFDVEKFQLWMTKQKPTPEGQRALDIAMRKRQDYFEKFPNQLNKNIYG